MIYPVEWNLRSIQLKLCYYVLNLQKKYRCYILHLPSPVVLALQSLRLNLWRDVLVLRNLWRCIYEHLLTMIIWQILLPFGWLAPPGNSWCRLWLGCWLGTTFLGGSLLTSTLPWFLGRTTAPLITTTRLSSFTHFWVEKSQLNIQNMMKKKWEPWKKYVLLKWLTNWREQKYLPPVKSSKKSWGRPLQ